MKKIILGFILSTLLYHSAFSSVTAEVEKDVVGVHEPIMLTIKSDENISSQPDLSVLKNLFNVISTSVSQQSYSINGKISSEMNWHFVLSAKQKGLVTIPSIAVGTQRTAPINITISDEEITQNEPEPHQSSEPVYHFFTELQKQPSKPFVQEQITYLVKLIDDGSIQKGEPTFNATTDFLIKSLGKPEVIQLSNGKREITFRFALFAQKSGKLQIPTVQFNGYAYQKPDIDNIFQGGIFSFRVPSVFGIQTPVELEEEGPTVDIMPAPKNYPGAWWLPAEDVSISSKFVQLPQKIKEGSAITREITLTAVGLTDTQLPELDLANIPFLKQYPESPNSETFISNGTLTGVKKTLVTYIPEQAGEIILPEIKVSWYSLKTGQIRTAILEKQKITVFPDSNLKKQGEKIQTRELEQKNNIPPLLPDKNIFSYSGFLAAFVLGAIGSYLIFRPKKEKQIQKQKIDIDTLCTNAGQNDLKKFRDDLIFWAQREYPQNSIKNLEDISKTLQCPELNEYFKKFSVVLYGKDQLVSFDTKKMVKVLKKAVKDYKKNRQNKKTPLPPLYQ